MPLTKEFLNRPQNLWWRKIFFQVHQWTGLVIGLYVIAISLSGSILVYRSELRQTFNPEPRIVNISGDRMPLDELTTIVENNYPNHTVSVWTNPEDPTHAITMQLDSHGSRDQWLFDPYTGEDLGNAMPLGWRVTTWLLDLHDNLLAGELGRTFNGVGAVLLTIMGITGGFIWWPGLSSWWRGLIVGRHTNWRRLNWSLHSALGFWTLAFILMWGLTGIYLAFPTPFMATVDYLDPLNLETFEPRLGDAILYWFASIHFGRFGGSITKLIWATAGLVPVILVITGGLIWWNRVVRRLHS